MWRDTVGWCASTESIPVIEGIDDHRVEDIAHLSQADLGLSGIFALDRYVSADIEDPLHHDIAILRYIVVAC